jgi:N-glycosylase/DNA lyase
MSNRFEMIDMLHYFIKIRFDKGYWDRAKKYSYYSSELETFNTYDEFIEHQRIILHEKDNNSLKTLIYIKNMITNNNNMYILDTNNMYPCLAHGIVFDRSGNTIIVNKY